MNDAIPPNTSFTARLDDAIDEAITNQRIVGAVILVAKDGEPAYQRAAGLSDREAGIPMRLDAIFRLASVTKPMVAATALALLEGGALSLDAPVTGWLPDFRPKLRDGREPEITVRQLLNHTSGFGYASTTEPDNPYNAAGISGGLDMPGRGMEENLSLLASVPLFHEPGKAWRYGMSIDVLGAVVGNAHGGTLAEAVKAVVTDPLGMADTQFGVVDPSRLAVPYTDASPAPIRMPDPYAVPAGLNGEGTVFSPSRIFNPASFQSGGAGMTGTASDFLLFVEAIRNGGGPILKPETAALACRNQIGDLPREEKDAGWRFGFLSAVLADPVAAKTRQSPGTLDWGGAYGHFWWIDPVAKLSVVSFSNTAFEGCNGAFRDQIRTAVYGP